MDYAVENIKAILKENKPTFGICLGHQLLALANDIPTYKMHHGHRGINHPVINLETGKCEITTQNHGFGVSPDALEANSDKITITHRNLNDQTIEGLKVNDKDAFSVQFHPEAIYIFSIRLHSLLVQPNHITIGKVLVRLVQ